MMGTEMLIDQPSSPTRSLLIQQVRISDTSGICNFRGNKKGELPSVSLPAGWALGQSWSVCLHFPLALAFLH